MMKSEPALLFLWSKFECWGVNLGRNFMIRKKMWVLILHHPPEFWCMDDHDVEVQRLIDILLWRWRRHTFITWQMTLSAVKVKSNPMTKPRQPSQGSWRTSGGPTDKTLEIPRLSTRPHGQYVAPTTMTGQRSRGV